MASQFIYFLTATRIFNQWSWTRWEKFHIQNHKFKHPHYFLNFFNSFYYHFINSPNFFSSFYFILSLYFVPFFFLYFSFPFSLFVSYINFLSFSWTLSIFDLPLISNNSLHIFPKIYYFIHFSSFFLISLIYPLFFLIFDLGFKQLFQKFSLYFPITLHSSKTCFILITYPSPTVDFFLFGVDFSRLSTIGRGSE